MSSSWQHYVMITIGSLITLAFATGCSLLKPLPPRQDTKSRLSAFPTQRPPLSSKADIYWDKHQIPFIHAGEDRDLPLLIGMVHAHLRLGQMELLRRASQGRLSEMMGPFTADIDHLLRIINFAKAVPAIKAGLPPETKAWLEAYCRGINFYVQNCPTLPPELKVLNIKQEPWTLDDVLTLGRLASADVNWFMWSLQFRIKSQPSWAEVWDRFKAYGKRSLPSFQPLEDVPAQLMLASSKSGSNSFVVSGRRTASGSGLIASDPHVGLQLPPLWVIVGFQSPSYHVLGLSIPGQPFVVEGRNRDIAWGGTNMMSLSSTFFDISGPAFDQLQERPERIKVRWWRDRKVTVRESELGPVLTDSKYLKKSGLPRLALKWRGHTFSDEFSTFLKVNRAADWTQFREAFRTWAVSGQNFLYADRQGNIGQLLAVDLAPAAARAGEQFLGDPQNPLHIWRDVLGSTDLPVAFNPSHGYLVSSNNMPIKTDLPISLFGNSNDRFTTISAELERLNPATVKDLMRVQGNVLSRNSAELAKTLMTAIKKIELEKRHRTQALCNAIAAWDGIYGAASAGAAAFELLVFYLANDYYTERYGEKIAKALLRSPAIYSLLTEDLAAGLVQPHLPQALKEAARRFKKLNRWDMLHRLRLSHPLGNVPLIGGKYRSGEYGVPGSSNTIYKSAHGLAGGKHRVTFGANARHVSDLSDLDENYFVLLGGQDGFWNSANYLDLFQLWRENQYVKVPMRLASVRKTAVYHVALRP